LILAANELAMKKNLKELTPFKHRCGSVGSMCPAVLESSVGTYIIIGKILDLDTKNSLSQRIGDDETVIEISAELLEEALATKHLKR
jgi:hypothetical protein